MKLVAHQMFCQDLVMFNQLYTPQSFFFFKLGPVAVIYQYPVLCSADSGSISIIRVKSGDSGLVLDAKCNIQVSLHHWEPLIFSMQEK